MRSLAMRGLWFAVVVAFSVLLGACGGGSDSPAPEPQMQIDTQPASATVAVGEVASLSVAASGTGALTYQWRRNGVNISGATAATLTTAATVIADSCTGATST